MYDNEYLEERFIKTKNKIRKIIVYKNSPNNILRNEHVKIVDFLNNNFTPSIFAKAYLSKRSIVDNASAHMYNNFFIMYDVKDFFNSINLNKLKHLLYIELSRNCNISKYECSLIVDKCSVKEKGLPLGLVPSPILSNIYLKQFDNIIYGKLKKMNLENIIYTRYADDITISVRNLTLTEDDVISITNQIKLILERFSLKLNDKKFRYYTFAKSNHVKITGINITRDSENFRRLTIGRKEKNQLYYNAINCFNNKNATVDEKQRIKGMESFILSVEGIEYENSYSELMVDVINKLGFTSLHELIKSL